MQEDWPVLEEALRKRDLRELSLVLSAVGIEHRIEPAEQGWQLRVAPGQHDAARLEVERYVLENAVVPERPPRLVTLDSGWAGVLGFWLVIWCLPWLESTFFELPWREVGAMHAADVRDGEWWRTITALTLHGDFAHLIANSGFGALFGLFVGRFLGSGFGWLLVLLAGALGNGLNALLQPDGFRSLGASTATFAALALVTTYVWRLGYFRGSGWRRSLAPLGGGLALLALTGTGGENTDVVAHFTGFAAGAGLGAAAAPFDPRRLGRSGQLIAGVLSLVLLVLAWRFALTAAAGAASAVGL